MQHNLIVEPIRLLDPLAEFLGALGEGQAFTFEYEDAIKLAGHSCPTIAGAFVVTRAALKALWGGDELPVRGIIDVTLKGGPEDLSYGPQSKVISLVTGAAGPEGFKGLGGRFVRKGLLHFDAEDLQFNTYIFKRTDTGKTVTVRYDPGKLGEDSTELTKLTPIVVKGIPSKVESERFKELWQDKVRRVLTETDKYPGLIEVEEVKD